MTSVITITFLTIGIILLNEIRCNPSKEHKETLILDVPKLPSIPALPGWPNLPSLPTLPGRAGPPCLPTLPGELPPLPALPDCPDLQTLPATTETPLTSTMVSSENSTTSATPETDTTTSGDDSRKQCPADQSLISENDLKTLTLKKIKGLRLAEILNETFFAEAVSINEVIKEDLQQFLAWFEDRPAHIKDLLNHLTSVRSKLEEVVIQKTEQLQEFTVLQNEYNYNFEKLQKINNKIEVYKGICKSHCKHESRETVKPTSFAMPLILDLSEAGGVKDNLIPTMKNGNKYYCTDIADLIWRIENILLQNLNTTIDNLKYEISNDSKMYVEKVEEVKKELKSLALSQFGPVMYDILNLQDQYYHYDQLLKSDFSLIIEGIKKQFAQFEKTNMDLELRAEKLRLYCFVCNSPVLASARHVNSHIKDLGTAKETDLLDHVVTNLFNDVSTQAFVDYKNIFNELELMFEREWDYINDKVATLNPVKEEIEKMTAQETEQLNKLKEAFPINSNEKVIKLERQAIELNEKANALNQELKKYNI